MAANLNNFQRWNSKKQVKKNMQASRCNKVTESNSKFVQEEKKKKNDYRREMEETRTEMSCNVLKHLQHLLPKRK
jgi:hypothetical protein